MAAASAPASRPLSPAALAASAGDDRLLAAQLERDHFAREVDQLKQQLARRSADTAELVAHLQAELQRKSNECEQLAARLHEAVERHGRESEERGRQSSARAHELEESFRSRLEHVEAQNARLQQELVEARSLRDANARASAAPSETDDLRQRLAARDRQYRDDTAALERQVLDLKVQLQEAQAVAERASTATGTGARRRASIATRKSSAAPPDSARASSGDAGEELRFLEAAADALQQQNDALREEARALRAELDLARGRDEEQTKRAVRQGKETRELAAKVKSLERSLHASLRAAEAEREETRRRHDAELYLARQAAQQAQLAAQAQGREAQALRRLAGTILQQRSELEQFFHQALEAVKAEARKERAAAKGEAAAAAAAAAARVHVEDLSALQRERVLKILFSLINRGAATAAPSAAPLASAADERGRTFVTEMKV
jgi:hypothetical protein